MKTQSLKRLSFAIAPLMLLFSCTDKNSKNQGGNLNSGQLNRIIDGTTFAINENELRALQNEAALGDLEANEKLLSYYYSKNDKLRSEIHLRRLYDNGHHVGLSTMGYRISDQAILLEDNDPTKLCELLQAELLIKRSRIISGISTKFPGDISLDNKIKQLREIHSNVLDCRKR